LGAVSELPRTTQTAILGQDPTDCSEHVLDDDLLTLILLPSIDYCDSIKGVGPKTALKLIREHGNIETILKKIDRVKYAVPAAWIPNETATIKNGDDDESQDEEESGIPAEPTGVDAEELIPVYVQARKLFNEHEVATDVELKWKPCQAEELTKFLVEEMQFNPDRGTCGDKCDFRWHDCDSCGDRIFNTFPFSSLFEMHSQGQYRKAPKGLQG